MHVSGLWVGLAVCAGLAVSLAARGLCVRRAGRGLQPEAAVRIGWDDSRLWVRYPDGQGGSVAWPGLRRVAIRTTDEGPWQPDVFWILDGEGDARVLWPQGATGEDGLVEMLQARLPGFDDRALIRAMGSTGNALFTLWERAAAALPNDA